MVEIPAGPFRFGLSARERAAAAQADGMDPGLLHFHSPAAELHLPGFWIDRHPVTRVQFLRFLQATGHRIEHNGWRVGWSEFVDTENLADPTRLACPMVGVNAADAAAYAEWAGKRLPLETEWEKAARGCRGQPYPWGWEFRPVTDRAGVLALDSAFPVGARPHLASPYGVQDTKGGVLEWTRTVFAPVSPDDSATDAAGFILRGSSLLHRRPSSHRVTSRWSWAPSMRLYNTGFRCAADTPPPDDAADRFTPSTTARLSELTVNRAAVGREPIVLTPTDHPTFMVHVPWFPGGLWVVDIPESTGVWGPFGGANAWPAKPPALWRVEWETAADGSHIAYRRREGDHGLTVDVCVEAAAVRCRITPENLGPINLASICIKALNPFFLSQERLVQHRLGAAGGLEPVAGIPYAPTATTSFSWGWNGAPLPLGASILRSLDGAGFCAVFGPPGCSFGGNGCYPCTHLHGERAFVDGPVEIRLLFGLGDATAAVRDTIARNA